MVIVVMGGLFLGIVKERVVNVGMGDLMSEFGVSGRRIEWVRRG